MFLQISRREAIVCFSNGSNVYICMRMGVCVERDYLHYGRTRALASASIYASGEGEKVDARI